MCCTRQEAKNVSLWANLGGVVQYIFQVYIVGKIVALTEENNKISACIVLFNSD